MEICRVCSNFLGLTPIRTDRDTFVCPLGERRRIRESAQTCELCDELYAFLQLQYGSSFDSPDTEIRTREISRRAERSRKLGERDLVSRFALSFDRVGSHLALAVWADEGTPASRDLVTNPPIFYDSLEEIHNLVQVWLDDCSGHHKSCGLSPESRLLENEQVILPTRLLSIAMNGDDISVKLVEPKGRSGRYCALSYCWGPKDQQPMMTTRSNLNDHLVRIPFNLLPRTFREAIELTRMLSIDYLWVDSLCIVQDDLEEWRQESEKMGGIYQRATLVIAAAGSKSSTGGLFIAERPDPRTFCFPYVNRDGVSQGTYNVAFHREDSYAQRSKDKPSNGPLRTRCWAFQEWYLSRRRVFFMPGGVTWKCRENNVGERNQSVDLGLYEEGGWLRFLHEYSSKDLTKPSDRLIAIRGIVDDMQKSRSDSYRFGVWKDKLATQLLWRFCDNSPQKTDFPSLPSWCWAATGGSKHWSLEPGSDEDGWPSLSTLATINVMDSGSIRASGSCLRVDNAPSPICTHCNRLFFWRLSEGGDEIPNFEQRLLPGYATPWGDGKQHLFTLEANGVDDVLGLAVIDRGANFPEVFCFVLASAERSIGDPCHPDYDGPISGLHESESTCSSEIQTTRCDFDSKGEEVGAEETEASREYRDIEESSSKSDETTEDGSNANEDVSLNLGPNTHEGDEECQLSPEKEFFHGCTDFSCTDFTEIGRSKEVYWALLLQPVDESLKKFKRVGICLLYPRAWEMMKDETIDIEIV